MPLWGASLDTKELTEKDVGLFSPPWKEVRKGPQFGYPPLPLPLQPGHLRLYPHPASLGPGINISLGQHTAPIVSTEGGMGAEGGGSARGHSPAHNEAILSRRRGLPHPVPRHPVLNSSPPPPSSLGLRQVTSLEEGRSGGGGGGGVIVSFVYKAGR